MSITVPEPQGYNEQDNCSNCNNDTFGEGKEYEHPDSEETVKDIFCMYCGVVVEIKEVEE